MAYSIKAAVILGPWYIKRCDLEDVGGIGLDSKGVGDNLDIGGVVDI